MVFIISAFILEASAVEFDAEKTYESVFVVYSGNQVGSGFAIAKNCVITNAHVLSDGSNTSILSYSGEEYEAIVCGIDYNRDIAILKIENGVFEPLQIGNIADCSVGDDVYAIGAPNNLPYTLTKGIISAKERVIADQTYIQIDAAINQGNSGGPLLTEDGKVIGINSMTFRGSEGLSLAIPIEAVFIVMEINDLSILSGFLETTSEKNDAPTEDIPSQEDNVAADDSAPLDMPDPEPLLPNQDTSDLKNFRVYLIIALCVIAFISVVVILLMYRSNRKKKVKIDMSDRTDFDIDILG